MNTWTCATKAILILGCALTVTVDTVGSRPWYDQRTAEIESAFNLGEIDEETYLEMMGETDQIRSDYLGRYYYRGSYSVYLGYPYYHHHYYVDHYHYHHRYRSYRPAPKLHRDRFEMRERRPSAPNLRTRP